MRRAARDLRRSAAFLAIEPCLTALSITEQYDRNTGSQAALLPWSMVSKSLRRMDETRVLTALLRSRCSSEVFMLFLALLVFGIFFSTP